MRILILKSSNCEIKCSNITEQWDSVKEAALNTIHLKPVNKPDSKWKLSILLAEHSPIRLLKINWLWKEIKSFVSTHFVRHKFGIEHFVGTQREDLIKKDFVADRNTLIPHRCEANAQSVINISRKRLCFKAHKETIIKWTEFLELIKEDYPELYFVCVPNCVYRGGCPEIKTCGLDKKYFKDIPFEDFKDIEKRYKYYHKGK